ncbi:MAG TPA: bifunctional 5,10-methylenetetrahydrofolate dehydrogenase/5,10-methenyltetrahydrofolate cyclohydrolase [Verrucomicrobiae bacterium]|nr:bifunctional 5,10-methylenetetrahydrofolate dehydrogenase/5,10-methenyltetrahydrofolate cyclohydrolase [Verrucomicrobiae bacterium]
MEIIDGKAPAAAIRDEIKTEVGRLSRAPHLNVMIVGGDPASHLYVSLKKKAGEEIGVRVDIHGFEATTPQTTLEETVKQWNADADVDGILIQLPLPTGYDADALIATLDPAKDVDGFHPKTHMISPVHEGVLRLIAQTDIKLAGSQVVILANSRTFAEPLVRLLKTAGAIVRVMDPDALDRHLLKQADVVVSAIGRLAFVHPSMTKDGAVIIDVGTNKTDEGKIRGDADFEAFKDTRCWVTPVPGGVGPMTIALMLRNVARLAESRS